MSAQGRPVAALLAVLPYVGAVGAVLYGVLRLAFLFFYMQLRTTPEEVGFGYAEVLASQSVGAVWLMLVLAVPLFALALIVRLALHAWHRPPTSTAHRPPRSTRDRSRPSLIGSAQGAAVASMIMVLVGLPFVAWTAGGDAAHGFAVRNVYLLGSIRLPVLAVQAVPAHITWTSDPSHAALQLQDRQCLLYLGQAGGVAVFYDVATEQSVRVPSSLIAVTLDNTTGVPYEC